MNLLPGCCAPRRLLLLAPDGADLTQFVDVTVDRRLHGDLLRETQKFRGQVYVAENSLTPASLLPDGRYVQAADYKSWHLLTLGLGQRVQACGRMLFHHENVGVSELTVSHSSLAQSEEWGPALRQAVLMLIRSAARRRMRFAELGGWAIAGGLRCTTEAIRMILAGYALAELVGGAVGITTATLCHHSSWILRRMGGKPLTSGGVQFPPYFEPLYRENLEVLHFDSSRPNPRYISRIGECRTALRSVSVLCAEPSQETLPAHLLPALRSQPNDELLAHLG